jgi:hypothetical protein
VSDWGYVALAYAVGWGALAVYAVLLARRVWQAQEVAGRLRGAAQPDPDAGEECDAPPAP